MSEVVAVPGSDREAFLLSVSAALELFIRNLELGRMFQDYHLTKMSLDIMRNKLQHVREHVNPGLWNLHYSVDADFDPSAEVPLMTSSPGGFTEPGLDEDLDKTGYGLGRVHQVHQSLNNRRDAVALRELLQADELTANLGRVQLTVAELARVREIIALNEVVICGDLASNQSRLDAAEAAGVEKGVFLAFCVARREFARKEAARAEDDKDRIRSEEWGQGSLDRVERTRIKLTESIANAAQKAALTAEERSKKAGEDEDFYQEPLNSQNTPPRLLFGQNASDLDLIDHGKDDLRKCKLREMKRLGRVLSAVERDEMASVDETFYDASDSEQAEVNKEKPGTGLTYSLTPVSSESVGPPEGSPPEPDYESASRPVRFKQSKKNKFNTGVFSFNGPGLPVMLPHSEEPRQLDMSEFQSVQDPSVGQDASTRNARGDYVNPEVGEDLYGTLAM